MDGTHGIILVSSNKSPSTNALVQSLLGGLDEAAAAAAEGAWPLLKANEMSLMPPLLPCCRCYTAVMVCCCYTRLSDRGDWESWSRPISTENKTDTLFCCVWPRRQQHRRQQRGQQQNEVGFRFTRRCHKCATSSPITTVRHRLAQ